jgi:hypothetical protein
MAIEGRIERCQGTRGNARSDPPGRGLARTIPVGPG